MSSEFLTGANQCAYNSRCVERDLTPVNCARALPKQLVQTGNDGGFTRDPLFFLRNKGDNGPMCLDCGIANFDRQVSSIDAIAGTNTLRVLQRDCVQYSHVATAAIFDEPR